MTRPSFIFLIIQRVGVDLNASSRLQSVVPGLPRLLAGYQGIYITYTVIWRLREDRTLCDITCPPLLDTSQVYRHASASWQLSSLSSI